MTDGPSYYDIVGFSSCMPRTEDTLPDIPDLSKIALFMDFDGTLVAIADRPDAVLVTDRAERLVAELSRRTGGAFAIVSGRRLSDLETFLPRFRGTLVGSHGAELRRDGKTSVAPEARSETFAGLRDVVRAWARRNGAILLEEKPASLVLHYRRAPEMQMACTRLMNTLAEDTPGFSVRHAKMAVELMPARICKKGAVASLLAGWPERMPVAIGDDRADEGMFALAEERGGYGIKVGDEETLASRRVRDVAAVHALLGDWLKSPAGAPCRVD